MALNTLTAPSIGLGDLPNTNPHAIAATSNVTTYTLRGYHDRRWSKGAPSGFPSRTKNTSAHNTIAANRKYFNVRPRCDQRCAATPSSAVWADSQFGQRGVHRTRSRQP